MPWGTDKRLMDLLDLANSKGYTFTKAIMRDHVRLTDPEGRRVETTALIGIAVDLHDRALEQKKATAWWIPLATGALAFFGTLGATWLGQ